MISYEETLKLTGKTYEDCVIRDFVVLKCDYCNKSFQRIKKSHLKTKGKDSCGNKECSLKKKERLNCNGQLKGDMQESGIVVKSDGSSIYNVCKNFHIGY